MLTSHSLETLFGCAKTHSFKIFKSGQNLNPKRVYAPEWAVNTHCARFTVLLLCCMFMLQSF